MRQLNVGTLDGIGAARRLRQSVERKVLTWWIAQLNGDALGAGGPGATAAVAAALHEAGCRRPAPSIVTRPCCPSLSAQTDD